MLLDRSQTLMILGAGISLLPPWSMTAHVIGGIIFVLGGVWGLL